MQLNHTHIKDIEARIKRLQTDFNILVKPTTSDSIRALALDEIEEAAQDIVTSVQKIKQENKE